MPPGMTAELRHPPHRLHWRPIISGPRWARTTTYIHPCDSTKTLGGTAPLWFLENKESAEVLTHTPTLSWLIRTTQYWDVGMWLASGLTWYQLIESSWSKQWLSVRHDFISTSVKCRLLEPNENYIKINRTGLPRCVLRKKMVWK